MRDLFDIDPGPRTEAEWRGLLGGLVASLSAFAGVEFAVTSWFVGDDRPDAAMASNCVRVRGVVNAALGIEACAVVCVTVNFGEAAWASADVLLFSGGRRVPGPGGADAPLLLEYGPAGWVSRGWVAGELGEWGQYETDARWAVAPPAEETSPPVPLSSWERG